MSDTKVAIFILPVLCGLVLALEEGRWSCRRFSISARRGDCPDESTADLKIRSGHLGKSNADALRRMVNMLFSRA